MVLNGKALAGTGVWRSSLIDGLCASCLQELQTERRKQEEGLRRRDALIALMGGEKPYREFTFERYEVRPGNRRAFESCKQFNPAAENLYLWGACGVGKTHLSYATARRCFEETLCVAILPAYQLSRKARLRGPEQEQAILDEWAAAEMLLLDDLGVGSDTAYVRQLVQEILDTRCFDDRNGLVITSKYSLDQLAAKLADDSIPSRLAGCCRAIEVTGADRRIAKVQSR